MSSIRKRPSTRKMPRLPSCTASSSRSARSRAGSPVPLQDQIAPQDAVLDDAVGEQLGAVAMLGAEHVEGDHGGRELGGRGRDQRQVGVELGQHLAGLDVEQHVADLGAGRAFGDPRRRGAAVRQRDLDRRQLLRRLEPRRRDQPRRAGPGSGLASGTGVLAVSSGGRLWWGRAPGAGAEQQQYAERHAPEDARNQPWRWPVPTLTETHHARSRCNMEGP